VTSPPLPAIQVVTARSTGGWLDPGDRWRWENNIFGGVYDDASPRDRPKYGALNFRGYPAGPELVALGLKLAREGYLDARIIGEAWATGRHDPQSLKRVWHLVARFG
jgi:hypothetical protein